MTGLNAPAALSIGTVVPYLRRRGLLDATAPATVTRLAGGVSGEVLAVGAGPAQLVVKQALPRLRVQADWTADPARILTEAAALRRGTAEALDARGLPTALIADEGGIGPALPSNRAALEVLREDIERAADLAPSAEQSRMARMDEPGALRQPVRTPSGRGCPSCA